MSMRELSTTANSLGLGERLPVVGLGSPVSLKGVRPLEGTTAGGSYSAANALGLREWLVICFPVSLKGVRPLEGMTVVGTCGSYSTVSGLGLRERLVICFPVSSKGVRPLEGMTAVGMCGSYSTVSGLGLRERLVELGFPVSLKGVRPLEGNEGIYDSLTDAALSARYSARLELYSDAVSTYDVESTYDTADSKYRRSIKWVLAPAPSAVARTGGWLLRASVSSQIRSRISHTSSLSIPIDSRILITSTPTLSVVARTLLAVKLLQAASQIVSMRLERPLEKVPRYCYTRNTHFDININVRPSVLLCASKDRRTFSMSFSATSTHLKRLHRPVNPEPRPPLSFILAAYGLRMPRNSSFTAVQLSNTSQRFWST